MIDLNTLCCPACGGDRLAPVPPPSPPFLPGEDEYRWQACDSCGSEFALPRKAMDYEGAHESTRLYPSLLKGYREQLRIVSECASGDRFNHSIAHGLLLGIQAPRRHLDIGAGNGFLLELARRAGYEVSGVEISKASRQFIAGQVPQARLYGSLEEAEGAYGILTALEVIEHLEDPLALLRSARTRLDPAGVLIVSVPNLQRPYWRFGARGFERRLWLADGAGDTAPHHLTRFTRLGLLELLTRAGFSSVYVGFLPVDAVHWMVYGVGARPSFTIKVAGLSLRFPFTLIKPFLTREVTLPLFERDETQGFGLMALASTGDTSVARLEQHFKEVRAQVVRRYVEYLDQDLLTKLWSNRRFLLQNLPYLPRMLRGR